MRNFKRNYINYYLNKEIALKVDKITLSNFTLYALRTRNGDTNFKYFNIKDFFGNDTNKNNYKL